MAKGNMTPEDKTFTCDKCDKNFSQESHLAAHKKLHAGKKAFNCTQCSDGFDEFRDLRTHLNTHRGHPYKCDICDKSFMFIWYLNKHAMRHSNEKPHLCYICNKRFKSIVYVKVHIERHNKERNFKCSQCSMTFHNKNELKMHIVKHTTKKSTKSVDKEDTPKCSSKSQLAKNQKHTKNEIKKTKPNKQIKKILTLTKEVPKGKKQLKNKQCSKCKKFFFRYKTLEMHEKVCRTSTIKQTSATAKETAIGMKESSSGKEISTNNTQELETSNDTKEKVEEDKQQNAEKRHSPKPEIPDEEKAFSCDNCDKNFFNRRGLIIHTKLHCKRKTLVKVQKDKGGSVVPKNVGLNEKKQLQCPICKKQLLQRNSLGTHMRLHSGDKPYKCLFCEKRFTVKCNMVTHLRVHTGERPFRCDVCGLRFSQKCSLDGHVRNYKRSGQSCANKQKGRPPVEQENKCRMCLKVFVEYSDFEKHIAKHLADKKPDVGKQLTDRNHLANKKQFAKKKRLPVKKQTYNKSNDRDSKLTQKAVVPLNRLRSGRVLDKNKLGKASTQKIGKARKGLNKVVDEESSSNSIVREKGLGKEGSPTETGGNKSTSQVVSTDCNTAVLNGDCANSEIPMQEDGELLKTVNNKVVKALEVDDGASVGVGVSGSVGNTSEASDGTSVSSETRQNFGAPTDRNEIVYPEVNATNNIIEEKNSYRDLQTEMHVDEHAHTHTPDSKASPSNGNAKCEREMIQTAPQSQKQTEEKEGQCNRLNVQSDLKHLVCNQSFPVMNKEEKHDQDGMLESIASNRMPVEVASHNSCKDNTIECQDVNTISTENQNLNEVINEKVAEGECKIGESVTKEEDTQVIKND